MEDALSRVMAAALVVGQARGVLYARVEQALALGADPLEVLRASGLSSLPPGMSTGDELAHRRRRSSPREGRSSAGPWSGQRHPGGLLG